MTSAKSRNFLLTGVFAALAFCASGCLDIANEHFSLASSGVSLSQVVAPPSLTPNPNTSPTSNPTSNPSPRPSPTSPSNNTTSNVMPITVNGSLCGDPNSQMLNEPCVSVTICAPGTSNCQTINNLLLDTGSVGLRVFSSVISVPLTPITQNGATFAECVQFGDQSSEWGQVVTADVILAGESAVRVPIEMINPNYATPPGPCTSAQSNPDTSPSQAGFNGILGVGLFAHDCGTFCSTQSNNGEYYSCSGNSCSSTAMALANQLQNPVSLLSLDNNGVILQLPTVSANGQASATGSLILGIGTRSNNQPTGVTAYAAADSGGGVPEFSTTWSAYSSTPMTGSFIDSGSGVYFIPPPSGGQLPDCSTTHGSGWQGWFCPTSTQTFMATNAGATGSSQGNVSFQIANTYSLFQTSTNMVFMNIGQNGGDASFDWGLPFFFGRSVFVGIDNKSSSIGTGSYWAY